MTASAKSVRSKVSHMALMEFPKSSGRFFFVNARKDCRPTGGLDRSRFKLIADACDVDSNTKRYFNKFDRDLDKFKVCA